MTTEHLEFSEPPPRVLQGREAGDTRLSQALRAPRICFVGLRNLPLLVPEFGQISAGGAELQQTLLAKALSRRGFEVSMVVADHGQPDGARWAGITTYRAYRPTAGIPGLRALHPRLSKVWAAMWRADADVYYTSCAGRLLLEVVAAARLVRRKVVFRIASDTDCDPARLLIQRRTDQRLYAAGLRCADLVLAQTPAQQAALRAHFQTESSVAPSLSETGRQSKSFAERDIDVLWVGNLRDLKRPDLLLDLARQLPALSFHMIGGPMPGAERLYADVRAAAERIPNLTFHGHMPYQSVGDYFARARLYVSTSNTEGFPNTFLQAWGSGTPVVTFLDPAELVSTYHLGRAVTDITAMQNAIATLRGDASAWERLSHRCMRYMREHHGEERRLEPYLLALSRLLPTLQPWQSNAA